MAGHADAPFSEMHRAVWAGPRSSGLDSGRPASPEGVGDSYLAIDTHILSICYGTSPIFVWTELPLDNIITPPVTIPPRSSMRKHTTAGQAIPDSTPTLVNFTFVDWDDESYGYTDDTISTPSDNVYEVAFALNFDASTPTVWTVTVLVGTSTEPDGVGVFTVNTSYQTSLQFYDLLYLPHSAGAILQIQVEQASGGSLDILTGSVISIKKVEN